MNAEKMMMGNANFTQVPNMVLRMYPLLDGFDIEASGLYAYLYSWRQNNLGHPLHNCVWLTHEAMQAQAGIGRGKFDRLMSVLIKYGLIRKLKATNIPNKNVYEVLEPLSDEEFRARYANEIIKFVEKIDALQRRIEVDRRQFAIKRVEWKERKIEKERVESVNGGMSTDELETWL
jgi:replication initiation and membrane attachment protein DnaB